MDWKYLYPNSPFGNAYISPPRYPSCLLGVNYVRELTTVYRLSTSLITMAPPPVFALSMYFTIVIPHFACGSNKFFFSLAMRVTAQGIVKIKWTAAAQASLQKPRVVV